jgi:hypothetical protein
MSEVVGTGPTLPAKVEVVTAEPAQLGPTTNCGPLDATVEGLHALSQLASAGSSPPTRAESSS